MTNYTIAFDVDGTLRKYRDDDVIEPNERIRTLLVSFCSLKNVKVVVWSKRGQAYAEDMVKQLGLTKYIKHCYEKGAITVDIAFDDQHEFDLGKINLIVNEIERTKKPQTNDTAWGFVSKSI